MRDSVHSTILKLETFSEHGLVSYPSSDYLPTKLRKPSMTSAQKAAFSTSLVVVPISDSPNPKSCEFQALDNLICSAHTPSDDDLLFKNISDPAISDKVVKVLSGKIKKGQIWRIGCEECVTVKLGIKHSKGQHPIKPTHTFSTEYSPSDLPSWIGDHTQIADLCASLEQLKEDRQHYGVFDRPYASFWELPLMVKRAVLMASFYENMSLGARNKLNGKAVQMMSWRAPN